LKRESSYRFLLLLASLAGLSEMATAVVLVMATRSGNTRVIRSRSVPGVSTVNLVTEHDGVGRAQICTYPTMIGLINKMRDGQLRLGPGEFHLVVVVEDPRPATEE
jgi:type I site-specific restriction endonuclease